jgi:hypothetical protein
VSQRWEVSLLDLVSAVLEWYADYDALSEARMSAAKPD